MILVDKIQTNEELASGPDPFTKLVELMLEIRSSGMGGDYNEQLPNLFEADEFDDGSFLYL